MRRPNRLIATTCGALLVWSVGCSDSTTTSSDSEPTAASESASTPAEASESGSASGTDDASTSGSASAPESDAAARAAAERDAQLAADIAVFEHAVGKSHGLTPEQIQEAVRALRNQPVMQNRFLGIRTLQQPSDAWIIMEIMNDVKPDLMVEAGTYHGGSAVLWAIVLEQINPDGEVITIDIEDQREPLAKEIPIAKEKVTFLLGSSTDPKVVAEVHRRAKGKRVLVLLDSLHSKEHVAAEIAAYAPIVSKGSYLIVQDTMLGPIAAIDEFLASNDAFIADRKRERYPDTNTTRGYLKRVKP